MRPPDRHARLRIVRGGPGPRRHDRAHAGSQGPERPAGAFALHGFGAALSQRRDYDELRLPVSRPAAMAASPWHPRCWKPRASAVRCNTWCRLAVRRWRRCATTSRPTRRRASRTVHECAGPACGASDVSLHGFDLGRLLVPANDASAIGDNSPAACAGGAFVGDLRYAVLQNKASGAAMALMSWKPGNVSAYCDEAAFKKHTSVFPVRVQPQAHADHGNPLGQRTRLHAHGHRQGGRLRASCSTPTRATSSPKAVLAGADRRADEAEPRHPAARGRPPTTSAASMPTWA